MGAFSIWHWLLVLVVAMLFFGRGRISTLMGDVGTGIRNLRQGLAEAEDVQTLAHEAKVPTVRAEQSVEDKSIVGSHR